MRITGGILGGRRLKVPSCKVRPTQDRVREALFSSLAGRIPGCRFLDLFAGSGAVGLEAWSRGASRVVWVEQDRRVVEVIKENISSLKEGPESPTADLHAVVMDGVRFLERVEPLPFDIIFADPPYDRANEHQWAWRILQAITASPLLLSEGGMVVIEQGKGEHVPVAGGWILKADRRYGEAQLRFFVRGGF